MTDASSARPSDDACMPTTAGFPSPADRLAIATYEWDEGHRRRHRLAPGAPAGLTSLIAPWEHDPT